MNMLFNILLIVFGALCVALGIFRIANMKQDDDSLVAQQPQVVVVEKHVHDVVTVPVPTKASSATNTNPQPKVTNTPNTEISAVDTAKEKGNSFEDFVANLLANHRFKLLERTCDQVSSAGVVAESCENPDFKVQQERGKSSVKYYLECKYRSKWDNGAVTFEKWQLDRYRKFQHDSRTKVIIALGVGGSPDNPTTFRLVPIDSISKIDNSIKQVKTEFAIQPTSSDLYDYMSKYFTEVFEVAKTRKRSN